ncbi:MAG: hypothetical protein KAY37_16450 [Phycisphaerae bacterium]|nr:hypothetical protein [Phycisphaerae bacterium]
MMPTKQPNEKVVSEESVPASTVIWRYLKFERFVEILKTHSVWFSRPFRFEDKWEGLFPPSYLRRTRQYADANDIPFDEFDHEFRKRLLRHRYAHFVNCWHISDHESDAMWKLYALAPCGIAIQSTVGDVNECLRPHNSGRVIYYDPSQDVRSPTIFGPHDILFKRSPFSWEQEYRFWFDDEELLDKIESGEEFSVGTLSYGRPVGITDMPRLVRKIVVAPGAYDRLIEQVRAACAEHRKRWLCNVIERSYSDRMWDSFTS